VEIAVAILISVLIGYFVYLDAKRFDWSERRYESWDWGITTALLIIPMLPLYLYARFNAQRLDTR